MARKSQKMEFSFSYYFLIVIGQVITAFTALPCRVGGVNRDPFAILRASGMSAGCVAEITEINRLRPEGKMAMRTTTRPLLAWRIDLGKLTDGLRSKRGF